MKKLAYLLITIIFLAGITVTFNACNEEDDTVDIVSNGSGEIEYMGKKYAINFGYYEVYGKFEDAYNYRVYLFSEGVDIENESGFGNAIAIYLASYSPPLTSETIPYESDSFDTYPSFSVQGVLEYDLDTQNGIELNFGDANGDLTITKSSDGKTYTIQFKCTSLGDEKTLTGKYTGKITEL